MKQPVWGVALILMLVLAGACVEGDREPAGPGVVAFDETEVTTADPCLGLAIRWLGLHQELLDAVGDSSVVELEQPDSPGAVALGANGRAMIEHARDAQAVDCAAEVSVGSPLLCAGIGELTSYGPAGSQILDELRASCRPS